MGAWILSSLVLGCLYGQDSGSIVGHALALVVGIGFGVSLCELVVFYIENGD